VHVVGTGSDHEHEDLHGYEDVREYEDEYDVSSL